MSLLDDADWVQERITVTEWEAYQHERNMGDIGFAEGLAPVLLGHDGAFHVIIKVPRKVIEKRDMDRKFNQAQDALKTLSAKIDARLAAMEKGIASSMTPNEYIDSHHGKLGTPGQIAGTQRVGTPERERAIMDLSRYMELGYLELDEFKTRMELASKATVIADLTKLFDDLQGINLPPIPHPHPPLSLRRFVRSLAILAAAVMVGSALAGLAAIITMGIISHL